MLFATTTVCSPSLCHPRGGNQGGGTGEHSQSNIQQKPTKLCSLPSPGYVRLQGMPSMWWEPNWITP